MGSTRAFAVLYGRHHQALYRYCRSIIHDENDAQDALQSAMERALASLQARQRDVAVRPWLFRIVHNEAVSLLRRRRSDVSLVEDLEPADGGLEQAVARRERFAGLITDLGSLAERQRAALVMRELSGLSIGEIAAALSTSPGAAKQAIFEARSALQELEEGRAMECEAVRRAISDGDRRVLRGRKIRAHVRACGGCRDFEATIGKRTAELRALAPPLPATAATAMLARLLAHGGGGAHPGVGTAASAASLGSHVAVPVTVKALAAVAVAGVATAGAVQIAASPNPHRPLHAPAHRAAPLSRGSGAASKAARGRHQGSTSLEPALGAKPHRAAAKVDQALLDTKAVHRATRPLSPGRGRAGGEIAQGRGHQPAGSRAHLRQHSGSPRSRTGPAHRSPNLTPPAPTSTPAREAAPTSASAEGPPARGGLNRPLPRSEAEGPLGPASATG